MTTCDHTYKLVSGKVFRCDAAPHPDRPSSHYFIRDKALEGARLAQRGGRLVVVPGERSDA